MKELKLENKEDVHIYLNRILQNGLTEVQIKAADIDINVILCEVTFFILYSEQVDILSLEVSANRIFVKLCKCGDEKTCYSTQIRGDNLVTRKKMDKVILGKRQSDCNNNEDIYSYTFFPFEATKGSINTKRASCSGYNDNLFAFFETLEQMYKLNFYNDEPDNKLKRCICEYRDFWELFGTGINGYKNYLDAFCLNCVEEFRKDNLEFFSKTVYSRTWREKNADNLEKVFGKYKALLESFHNKRKGEICKRIQVNNIGL